MTYDGLTMVFGIEEGYEGQRKGLYQVLFERGLYVPGMRARETDGEIHRKALTCIHHI